MRLCVLGPRDRAGRSSIRRVAAPWRENFRPSPSSAVAMPVRASIRPRGGSSVVAMVVSPSCCSESHQGFRSGAEPWSNVSRRSQWNPPEHLAPANAHAATLATVDPGVVRGRPSVRRAAAPLRENFRSQWTGSIGHRCAQIGTDDPADAVGSDRSRQRERSGGWPEPRKPPDPRIGDSGPASAPPP